MTQFRITNKYAKDLRLKNLPLPCHTAHILDDWFVDCLYIARKKVAMAVHGKSLYTLFISYSESGGTKYVSGMIGMRILKFLDQNGITSHMDQARKLFDTQSVFCKTADRKILAHMNDFKQQVDGYIYPRHYSLEYCLEELEHRINEMPVNLLPKQFSFPVENFLRLLSAEEALSETKTRLKYPRLANDPYIKIFH